MSAYVFVSYSRSDALLVTPIVRLLRTAIAGVPSAAGRHWEFVFQDIDSIEPGSGWKDQIDAAIRGSERMLVFWCTHAAMSDQVQREYALALRLAKVVVPVLLDSTPLAQALAPINGVDLRELGTHRPQYRFAVPGPGGRNPHEVIVHGFAQALDMDPLVLMSNLFPAASGPPL